MIVLQSLVGRRVLGKLRSPALVSLAMTLVSAAACGGNSAPAQVADDAAEATASTDRSSEEQEDDSEADASETTESTAPADTCENGTCFACGAGFCLSGWYCDEGAPGGAACSWIPACATKATCGCIGKVLGSGCSCKEDKGGAHVTCG